NVFHHMVCLLSEAACDTMLVSSPGAQTERRGDAEPFTLGARLCRRTEAPRAGREKSRSAAAHQSVSFNFLRQALALPIWLVASYRRMSCSTAWVSLILLGSGMSARRCFIPRQPWRSSGSASVYFF